MQMSAVLKLSVTHCIRYASSLSGHHPLFPVCMMFFVSLWRSHLFMTQFLAQVTCHHVLFLLEEAWQQCWNTILSLQVDTVKFLQCLLYVSLLNKKKRQCCFTSSLHCAVSCLNQIYSIKHKLILSTEPSTILKIIAFFFWVCSSKLYECNSPNVASSPVVNYESATRMLLSGP